MYPGEFDAGIYRRVGGGGVGDDDATRRDGADNLHNLNSVECHVIEISGIVGVVMQVDIEMANVVLNISVPDTTVNALSLNVSFKFNTVRKYFC